MYGPRTVPRRTGLVNKAKEEELDDEAKMHQEIIKEINRESRESQESNLHNKHSLYISTLDDIVVPQMARHTHNGIVSLDLLYLVLGIKMADLLP